MGEIKWTISNKVGDAHLKDNESEKVEERCVKESTERVLMAA